MLGERKQVRIDRFKEVENSYGGRTPTLVESFLIWGFVYVKGGKRWDGVTFTDEQLMTIQFHAADVEEVNVGDKVRIDGAVYSINSITRERFVTIVTCKADGR